jgi:CubicO group peptidase (beta-lactamase class C family)
MMRTRCAAFVTVLLLATVSLRADDPPASVTDKVDEIFAEFDATNSPGCAVGVLEKGEWRLRRGYGMASLEHGVPNATDAVYYIGSTSKQFVAASILLAAEQGNLSLDDDIRKYLPEIPEYQAPITIRNLVHHTSGLRDYLGLMYLADMRAEDIYSDAEIIELIARQKALNFDPGSEYLYSNSGYFLMAQIIGRATGKSLREFAEENIFRPLGMTRTHFHDDRLMIVPGRASAYKAAANGFELDFYTNFDKVGSGGLLSTVEDLARWDANFDHNILGKGSLIEAMMVRGVLNNGEELDYAFAIVHGEHRGRATISHGGAFMGFRAQLLRFPGEQLTVISLCNVGHANPGGLSLEVADVFLEEGLAENPSEDTADGSPEPEHETIEVSAETLESYTGTYKTADSTLIRDISVTEGTLWYVRGEDNQTELQPIGPDRFAMKGTAFEVSFDTVEEVRTMTVVGPGEEYVLKTFDRWKPSETELSRYLGSFYSEELDATHRVETRDGEIALMIGRNPERHPVEPLTQEAFAGDGFAIRYEGDGSSQIMILEAGRVRGLRFSRVAAD